MEKMPSGLTCHPKGRRAVAIEHDTAKQTVLALSLSLPLFLSPSTLSTHSLSLSLSTFSFSLSLIDLSFFPLRAFAWSYPQNLSHSLSPLEMWYHNLIPRDIQFSKVIAVRVCVLQTQQPAAFSRTLHCRFGFVNISRMFYGTDAFAKRCLFCVFLMRDELCTNRLRRRVQSFCWALNVENYLFSALVRRHNKCLINV